MKQGNVEPHTKHPQHEGSEPVGRNDSHDTRSVGRQARRDLDSGMQDTDRRGGEAYQQRTGGGPDSHRQGDRHTQKERH